VQTYAFEQPESAIDLMAGPYRVTERSFAAADGRKIALRALLHPEIAERGDGDLDAVERYLRLYEGWIGPYPYESFSVVSSPTPTGFGMPTLTYLGVEVLRLPFIRDTSLGHEVLHNWWGNGVRPDYARGNWSEGLTTFMADYAYREQAGAEAAREMRLAWLRDFAALGSAADRPLASFSSRTHGAEQVVGYHKAAMVFLMLRDAIGTEPSTGRCARSGASIAAARPRGMTCARRSRWPRSATSGRTSHSGSIAPAHRRCASLRRPPCATARAGEWTSS
jgi:aminopeptidase N